MFGPLGRCTTGMKSLGLWVVVALVLVAAIALKSGAGSNGSGGVTPFSVPAAP